MSERPCLLKTYFEKMRQVSADELSIETIRTEWMKSPTDPNIPLIFPNTNKHGILNTILDGCG